LLVSSNVVFRNEKVENNLTNSLTFLKDFTHTFWGLYYCGVIERNVVIKHKWVWMCVSNCW